LNLLNDPHQPIVENKIDFGFPRWFEIDFPC
jgi:hypothetical protein